MKKYINSSSIADNNDMNCKENNSTSGHFKSKSKKNNSNQTRIYLGRRDYNVERMEKLAQYDGEEGYFVKKAYES